MFLIPHDWLNRTLLLAVAISASVYVSPAQAAHSADESLLSVMHTEPDSLYAQKLKSVLYLGGGDRSPWFHLGALYAIEEYKIPVDSIVATSWGAWMGALWSLGVSIDDLQRLMLDPAIVDFVGVNTIQDKTRLLDGNETKELGRFPKGSRHRLKEYCYKLETGKGSPS